MRPNMPKETAATNSVSNTAAFALFLPDLVSSGGGSSTTSPTGAAVSDGKELQWADLTSTEKSAASLGVSPDAWKPISFMNTAHYDTLLKTNALDSELAKHLEAYKHVSLGGS